jgi:hypothetical protein
MKMSCIEGNVLVLRSAFGASIDVVVVAPPRSMWYLLHTVVHTDNAESRWMDGWWLLWYVHSMGMVIEEPAQSGLMSLHSTDSSVGCTAKIENIGIYLSDVEDIVEGGTRWRVDKGGQAREWPISSRHFSTKSSRHFSISSRHYRTTFLPARIRRIRLSATESRI